MKETEAQRIIHQQSQQAQQETQREVQQFTGRLTEYAEETHRDRMRQGRFKTEQAQKEAKESKAKTKENTRITT